MKKILTTAAAVFALVAVSNAQLFVGGNLGVTANGEAYKNEDGDKIKQNLTEPSMSINFNPKVGYQLNDKMSVGGILMLGTSTTKVFDGTKDNDVVSKRSKNTLGLAPFFRYSFVEFGGFKISADATLPLTMSTSKTKPDEGDDVKGPKTMGVELNIVPVISYSISDRIDLEAQLNVFNLGFAFSSSEVENPLGLGVLDDVKNNETSFNLGVSPNNVCTTGAIKIGMIFKF